MAYKIPTYPQLPTVDNMVDITTSVPNIRARTLLYLVVVIRLYHWLNRSALPLSLPLRISCVVRHFKKTADMAGYKLVFWRVPTGFDHILRKHVFPCAFRTCTPCLACKLLPVSTNTICMADAVADQSKRSMCDSHLRQFRCLIGSIRWRQLMWFAYLNLSVYRERVGRLLM